MTNPQKPFIVKLAILTVLTSLIWTGFDVYRRLTAKPTPQVPAEILSPIIPELNPDTLAHLEQTTYLEGDQLGDTLLLSSENEVIEPEIPLAETELEEPLEEATEESEIPEP